MAWPFQDGGHIGGGGYIPPPGAVSGGQPDGGFHGAFPGFHGGGGGHGHGAPPPSWLAQGQGQGHAQGPWGQPAGGGGGWANTPGPQAHYPPTSGVYPGWANTPHQQHQQQQPQTAAWANTPTPWGGGGGAGPPVSQGWGSAGHTPAMGYPPQDAWGNGHHASTSGFSAMAAPPPSANPATAGWAGQVTPHPAFAHHGHHGHGHGRRPHPEEPEEEYFDYDAEEAQLAEEEAWAAAAGGGGGSSHGHGHRQEAGWATHPPEAGWATPGWGDEQHHQHAMRRTHSAGKSPGRPKHRERAHSFSSPAYGHPQQHPHSPHPAAWANAQAYAYNEDHLAKRPILWRSDYPGIGDASMSAGASLPSTSFSLFRRKSSSYPTTTLEASEWHDPKKRIPCPTLTYPTSSSYSSSSSAAYLTRFRIAYDMRAAPDQTPLGGMGAFMPRDPGEMMQPAVNPAAKRMRLVLGRCPWYVDVKPASGAPFVTLFDVLSALHTQLATPIEAKDYFTKALTKAERARITKAFSERCDKVGRAMREVFANYPAEEQFEHAPPRNHTAEEIARGVRRVDFLTGECFFVGLVRKGGVWEARCVREIAQ